RWDLLLMLVVLVMTIFVDLITAVGIGVVLAAVVFVKQVAKDQMERLSAMHQIIAAASPREQEILNKAGEKITVSDFSGPLSFGAAADLGHHARAHLDGGSQAIVMDFSRVPFLDVSAALAVETVVRDAAQAGRAIYMCGLTPQNRQVLKALEADKHLPEAHCFERREEAL